MDTHLENTVKLRGKHHVPLGLQFAGHECLLAVELALSELCEGVVGEDDGDVGLRLCRALVHRAGLFHVDCPDALCARSVLDVELEDALRLQDAMSILL